MQEFFDRFELFNRLYDDKLKARSEKVEIYHNENHQGSFTTEQKYYGKVMLTKYSCGCEVASMKDKDITIWFNKFQRAERFEVIQTMLKLMRKQNMKFLKKYRKERHNLFVYGTLMVGYGNHRYLEGYEPQDAVLEGYRRIWPHDTFPVIIKSPNDSVKGEFYQVDGATLREMDILEGIPYLYTRDEVKISSNGKTIIAFAYVPTERTANDWINMEKREQEGYINHSIPEEI